MNPINGTAAVSCYVDAASLLIMILVLCFSGRLRHRANPSLRIFKLLSLCITFICICPFVYNAMYMQPARWCHTAAVISKTLRECTVLVIVVLWLMYVYRKLFGEKSHLKLLTMVCIPLAVFMILLIVNLFTGIVFTFSSENRFRPKTIMYIIFAVEFLYFVSSAFMVRYYDRKSKKTRFLRVSPMIIFILEKLDVAELI